LRYIKYGHRISGSANGRIKNGIIFSTYACLIAESHSRGEYQTRMDQILKWCHHDFYGVIVFDECYQAKNCVPICSGTAKKVTKGQDLICICNWSLGTTPPRVYGPIGTIQWYTMVLHSMVRRFQLKEERYIWRDVEIRSARGHTHWKEWKKNWRSFSIWYEGRMCPTTTTINQYTEHKLAKLKKK
jgi:NAD-dependent dihydropyrimidine dehydrogenase PreA subunit